MSKETSMTGFTYHIPDSVRKDARAQRHITYMLDPTWHEITDRAVQYDEDTPE